ncbi:MAG: hypothetical protein KAJ14_13950 [Candidatus Omnitrophica bacterium]|nr:hypothetical protein [Candidatus Omnitrophota bacterium]
MKDWVNLKIHYFKRKTQALTELAIFGSILLLVFAFMIRMGLVYMHRQDINMKAFRKAMVLAPNVDKPDPSATVLLVEDKHIPDPRDIVGTGDFTPVQGYARVVWGNTMPYYIPKTKNHVYDINTDKDLSTMHFEINDKKGEYLIEGYGPTASTLPNVSFIAPFYAYTQTYGWKLINQSDARVYNPESDEPIAVYLDGSKIKDTITKVKYPGSIDILNVLYVEPMPAPNEHQVSSFYVLNAANGDINLNYLSLNADLDEDGTPDVTPANMQGLFSGNTTLKRRDSVKIKQTGGTITSKTKQKLTGTIEHRLKTNSGEDNFDYSVNLNETTTW